MRIKPFSLQEPRISTDHLADIISALSDKKKILVLFR